MGLLGRLSKACLFLASLAVANESNVQFKQAQGDQGQASVTEMEMGVDFHDVTDEIHMETIQIDDHEGFNTYVSPEVKKKAQFKFFNNTYMYVSFREEFIAKPKEQATEGKLPVRELYRVAVAEYLKNAKDKEGKLKDVNVKNLTFKQAHEDHVSFTVNDQKDFQKIANNLKQRKEILAIEWLDKKKVFGDKASLDEMSAFKSRVKKQKVVYDPDSKIDYEEIKRKQDQKAFDKKFKEEMKKGKVRTPKPYMGNQPHDEL